MYADLTFSRPPQVPRGDYNTLLKHHVEFTNPYATPLMTTYFGFSENQVSSFLSRKSVYVTDYYDVIHKEQTKQWATQMCVGIVEVTWSLGY